MLAIERNGFATANIALIAYSIGVIAYITAPQGLRVGDAIVSSWKVDPNQVGNAAPLLNIPLNVKIHNIESFPGSGAVFARAAGT